MRSRVEARIRDGLLRYQAASLFLGPQAARLRGAWQIVNFVSARLAAAIAAGCGVTLASDGMHGRMLYARVRR